MIAMRCPALLLSCLILSSCAVLEDEATPPEPTPSIVVTGEFVRDLDFGEVSVGDSELRGIVITNEGPDAHTLLAVTVFPEQDMELDGVDGLPRSLAPGEAVDVVLAFRPARDGDVQGVLTVVSDDFVDPRIEIGVVGSGLGPEVRLDPESWEFGDLALGCEADVEVGIRNVGRAPLVLNQWRFEDLAGNGEMTVEGDIPPGTVLPPGDQAAVTIRYLPTDVAPDTGILTLESSDPQRPAATVTATGLGHYGDAHTDTWTVASPALDLVFVLDTTDGWTGLDFGPFVDAILDTGLDLRLAMITTDLGAGVSLLGPVATHTSLDLGGELTAGVAAAAGATFSNRGFDTAYQLYATGASSEFDRADDAGLHLVFVSTRQETSNQLGTVADYVNFFYSLRSDPDTVVISEMTGGLSGCSGDVSAGSGSDYVAAAVATGGVSTSICDPARSANLAQYALAEAFERRAFLLSEPAIVDSIEVRVNGGPVVVWTWDAERNAVVFPTPLPEGAVVTVDYSEQEDCSD